MAKLYFSNADGSAVALRVTAQDDAIHGQPAGTTAFVFDAVTNQAIVDSLAGNVPGFAWQDHKVVGGALQRKGVTMAVNPDHANTTERNGLLNAAANAITTNNAYIALATPTVLQTNAQVQALSQQNNRIIRNLVRIIQGLEKV